MYNGIGVATVRGTATSGHVTRNKASVRSNWQRQQQDRHRGHLPHQQNIKRIVALGNRELQHHARARELENKLLIMREELEKKGLPEEAIEARIKAQREDEKSKWDDVIEEGEEANDEIHLQVVREAEKQRQYGGQRTCFNCGQAGHLARDCHSSTPKNNPPRRPAPSTNTHLEQSRKEKANSEFAKALGIREHVEGAAFDQELQRQRRNERKALLQREEAMAAKEEKKISKNLKIKKKEEKKRIEQEQKVHIRENKKEMETSENSEVGSKSLEAVKRKPRDRTGDDKTPEKRRSSSSSVSSSSGSNSTSSNGSSSSSSSSSTSYTSSSSTRDRSRYRSRRSRRRSRLSSTSSASSSTSSSASSSSSSSRSRSITPPQRVAVKDNNNSTDLSDVTDRKSRRRNNKRSKTPPSRRKRSLTPDSQTPPPRRKQRERS